MLSRFLRRMNIVGDAAAPIIAMQIRYGTRSNGSTANRWCVKTYQHGSKAASFSFQTCLVLHTAFKLAPSLLHAA
jgi:hypothetical protein